MIKYMAHDLRCNIIVFDLVLDQIQFISRNQLKINNVVFDSPLLVYATGNHYQSVMQQDHEYFINLARQLELANARPAAMVPAREGEGSASSGNSTNVGAHILCTQINELMHINNVSGDMID